MSDPKRLLNEGSALERAMLDAATQDGPSEASIKAAALSLGFEPVSGVPVSGAQTGAATKAALSASLTKAGLAVVLMGSTAVGLKLSLDKQDAIHSIEQSTEHASASNPEPRSLASLAASPKASSTQSGQDTNAQARTNSPPENAQRSVSALAQTAQTAQRAGANQARPNAPSGRSTGAPSELVHRSDQSARSTRATHRDHSSRSARSARSARSGSARVHSPDRTADRSADRSGTRLAVGHATSEQPESGRPSPLDTSNRPVSNQPKTGSTERSAPKLLKESQPLEPSLLEELRLIETAREALRQKDAKRARDLLEPYPGQRLAVEAEALLAEAWLLIDPLEGHERIRSFLKSHPDSPLGARLRRRTPARP